MASYPTDGATASEIRERADQAMYWAKSLFGNLKRTKAVTVLKADEATSQMQERLIRFSQRINKRLERLIHE